MHVITTRLKKSGANELIAPLFRGVAAGRDLRTRQILSPIPKRI